MDRIIAGRFQTKIQADAAAALVAVYVDTADICVFHNNAPGQHDTYAVGGDEEADPGARGAEGSAGSNAVAAGLAAGAIGAIGGPITALAAAGVGAYTASLVGALDGMTEDDAKQTSPQRRPAGVILSVHITGAVDERRVIATLRAQSAADIERAQGEWRNGDWADFNPVERPRLI
jgi:hypothetical protein